MKQHPLGCYVCILTLIMISLINPISSSVFLSENQTNESLFVNLVTFNCINLYIDTEIYKLKLNSHLVSNSSSFKGSYK